MLRYIFRVVFIGLMGATIALYPMEKVVIKDYEDAIRDIGAQMANMRNMLEVYALIGVGVDYKDPQKRLEDMISSYEQTLNTLAKRYKNDKFIQNSIAKSKEAWEPLKKELSKALGGKETKEEMKKGAIFVHDHMRSVIKELEDMKHHLVVLSKTKHTKMLDAAIEVAASARRISSHYMMKMWNLDDPTIKEHTDRGAKILKESLDTLSASTFVKDENFKKQLDKAKGAYNFLMNILKFKRYVPVAVQDNSDTIYKAGMAMTAYILEHKLSN